MVKTMETVDGLPKGMLDQFHKHRMQNYSHLYYCYRCVRTFDSKEPVENCKFCDAAVRDITGTKFEHPLAQKYRYYCTKCEKNFESFSIFENCAICGNKIVHVYRWEELNMWEKISVRIKKMVQPAGRTATGGMHGRKFGLSLNLFRREQEELPTR